MAPIFSKSSQKRIFLSIAAAEIALLSLLLLLFFSLKEIFDPSALLSIAILVLGAFTYGFIRSVALAHSTLFLCILAIELLLYFTLPVGNISFVLWTMPSNEVMLAVFAAIDIFLAYWIFGPGIASSLEQEAK
jgi:hypothetical protein